MQNIHCKTLIKENMKKKSIVIKREEIENFYFQSFFFEKMS